MRGRSLHPRVELTPHGVNRMNDSSFSSDVRATSGSSRRRKRTRLKLTPRFWTLLVLAGVLYIGTAYAVGFVKIHQLALEIRSIEAELAVVEAQNEELRQRLEYMNSDEYIESVARSELGLVRPGETAVVVVTSNAGEDPIATERTSP